MIDLKKMSKQSLNGIKEQIDEELKSRTGLKHLAIGTKIRFKEGVVGMVISGNGVKTRYTYKGKAVVLLAHGPGQPWGEIAYGYLSIVKAGHYTVIEDDDDD